MGAGAAAASGVVEDILSRAGGSRVIFDSSPVVSDARNNVGLSMIKICKAHAVMAVDGVKHPQSHKRVPYNLSSHASRRKYNNPIGIYYYSPPCLQSDILLPYILLKVHKSKPTSGMRVI